MHDRDLNHLLILTGQVVLVISDEAFVGCVMSAGNRNNLDSFSSSILGEVQASIETGDTPNDIAGTVVGVMNIKSIFVVVEVVNFS